MTHRPTTNADLKWAREMMLEMTATIDRELNPANRFIGYLDEDTEPKTEEDAWICADDSGDYLSAALDATAFLAHYMTEGFPAREDGWTLGAIHDLNTASEADEDIRPMMALPLLDRLGDIPTDIEIFIEALSTAR